MTKDLKYYLSLPYRKIIVPAKEGGYVGYIPELNGCITQAETKEELMKRLDEAKKDWLTAALEDGIEIPNKETLQAMQDVLHGKNLSRTYDSADEVMRDLND
ncbi:MAG: type II toxin-antitoxin system HicB family antitoxin [Mitsuokella sp.]|uniref:type II toxin-antitoxin system HicB family antitoxin n=1 Tax=Mitsuokella sp. TaxID=2049034 RepID=UPI003D7EEBA3